MGENIYGDILHDNCYVTKTNKDGVITFVNDKFSELTGFNKEELVGQTHSVIKSFDTKDETFNIMWDTILKGEIWNGVIKNRTKNGRDFFTDTTIYPVKDETGNIQEFISFRNDLTHYIDLLTYDQLTGLKNRDTLKHDISTEKKYMCVIINIDNFSDIAEFYGGYIGDKVLIEVAKRLKNTFKGMELYRLQGDEFAILKILPPKNDEEILEAMIKNKLRSIFDESFYIDDIDIHITVTSGFSIDDHTCLRNANIAFKEAKSKNLEFTKYDETMLLKFANFSKNKKVAGDIKTAIKQDQIIPYYQPIIDNKTGNVAKYEALARLIKEDDIVPPGAFIDVSKKIKYYHKITRAILEKSFKNFSHTSDIGVSINLTIEDIANVRTFNLITELLSKNKHNENITFELVESDGIEDYELFDKFVKTVKRFGAKISIDDFGTGYSNFSYLAKIEPDFLKIDGSLIKNIQNSKDFDVVKTIIEFAKLYNIKTVAEFVEDEDIFILVKELGIDYSQGYYFGKPVAIEDI